MGLYKWGMKQFAAHTIRTNAGFNNLIALLIYLIYRENNPSLTTESNKSRF